MPPIKYIVAIVMTGVLCSCSQQDKVSTHIEAGNEYLASYDFIHAKKEFLEANRIDFTRPDPLRGLAYIYHSRGRIKQAYQALTRYNELKSDNPEIHYLLAVTYLRANKADKAIQEAIESLQLDPSETRSLIVFAKAHRGKANTYKALQYLDTLAEPNAQIPNLNIAKGILHAKLNQTVAAKKALHLALQQNPNADEAFLALAILHWQLNQLDQSNEFFQKAINAGERYSSTSLEYANFKRKTGEIDAAWEILTQKIAIAPDQISTLVELANIALETDRIDEGIKHTASALAIDKLNPTAILIDGKLKLAAGKATEAIETLLPMTQRYPNSGQANLQLALAYLADNKPNKALGYLQRTRRITPDSSEANILLAGLDIRQSDLSGAISKLKQFSNTYPENKEVRLFLADTLRYKGDIEEALNIYLSLHSETPNDPNIPYSMGLCFFQQRNLRETKAAFEQALLIDNSHFPSVRQLVIINSLRGDYDQAHALLDKFAEDNEPTDSYHLAKGVVYLEEKKQIKAQTALEKAIKVNSQNTQAYLLLSQVLLDAERRNEAIANLTESISNNPKDIDSLMRLGGLYGQNDQLANSASCYKQVLGIDPNFAPALNNLAYLNSVYFDDLDTAYDLANKARQINPNDPNTADTLGWILFKQRKYAWALSLISESAAKMPNNPEVQYHLGMIHYMLGDQATAHQTFANATNTDNAFTGKADCLRRIEILDTDPLNLTPDETELLEGQLAKNPIDTICLLKLAKSKSKIGPQTAIQFLDTILEINPENPYALIQKAIIHEQLNQPDQAFELAKNAYSTSKDNTIVNKTLGRLAYSKNQIPWSATLFAKALAKTPEDDQTRYSLAKADFTIGRIQTARALLADMPIKSDLHHQAAQLQQLITNYETSTPDNVSEIQLIDNDPFLALANQAQRLDQYGESQQAQNAYLSLIATYPDFTPAKSKLAISLYRSETYNNNAYNITVSAYGTDRNNPELKKAMDAQVKNQEER